MKNARIPGFYKLSIRERLRLLEEQGWLSDEDHTFIKNGHGLLKPADADKMIENVVGSFGLPVGMGLNFLVNGKEYVVPMVVEEPSIVAAVSFVAKIVREAGGFKSESSDPILIGQIQVVNVKNTSSAKQAILQNKEEIINLANSLHPNMVARGGGARDVEVRILPSGKEYGDMVIVHLLVDVRDAMGANLVNSMCEGVASLIEKISGGEVFLRILSNLTDRSLVRTRCTIPVELLAGKGFSGPEVRDGIILANDFAIADPYRAATHNKGIMNGIDPLIIATGNDWRAAEAAAHAYAARGGKYTSLTKWTKNAKGDLEGYLEIPIRVGTVGGSLQSNPMVPVLNRILDISSSNELAELIGAVGLAQNMAAIRALATEGIQQGHMSLHARSVAMAAGAAPEIFENVVEQLIDTGEIKIWKAKEIIESLESSAQTPVEEKEAAVAEKPALPMGYGKVILLGEHAVVYGSEAIAAPVPLAMEAKVSESDKDGVHLIIPRWGVEERLQRGVDHKYSIFKSLDMILDRLDLHQSDMKIEVFPHIPRAMGLGGSAALAVAIIRALDQHYKLKMSDEQIRDLSFESEIIVHGKASGIDNTLATFGRFIRFKKGDPPFMENITLPQPLRVVVGLTWQESLTAKMVAKVNKSWEKHPQLYERIFSEIGDIVKQAAKAIEYYDLPLLGELMNINHGLLNALQVSSREIEEIVDIARNNGALGAKLTGGGGGGAAIALCPENSEDVAEAIKKAGYRAMVFDLE